MFPFAPTRARDQGRVARAQDLPPGTAYRVVHPSPGSGAALPVPGTVPASPRTTTPPPRVRDPTRVSGAGAALPRTGIGAAPPVPGTLPTRVRTCRQQRVDQHRPPVHGPGHTRPPPLRSAPHRQPLSGGAAPRRVEGGGAGGGGGRRSCPTIPPPGRASPAAAVGGLAGRSPPERGGNRWLWSRGVPPLRGCRGWGKGGHQPPPQRYPSPLVPSPGHPAPWGWGAWWWGAPGS